MDDKNNDREEPSAKPSMLEPVRKIRIYESIVRQIQKLITGGKLKPGDKLPPERQLAEELQVSRTSIREALRALEMMGYLESRVGVKGGTYVRDISFSSIFSPFTESFLQQDGIVADLAETRHLLEIEVARLAAERRTQADLRELEKTVQRMERDIESGAAGIESAKEFHRLLANAASNRVLLEFANLCADLLKDQQEEPQRALNELKEILEAIQEKDGGRARDRMKEHLLKGGTDTDQSRNGS